MKAKMKLTPYQQEMLDGKGRNQFSASATKVGSSAPEAGGSVG